MYECVYIYPLSPPHTQINTDKYSFIPELYRCRLINVHKHTHAHVQLCLAAILKYLCHHLYAKMGQTSARSPQHLGKMVTHTNARTQGQATTELQTFAILSLTRLSPILACNYLFSC